jgi:hypothetical protein
MKTASRRKTRKPGRPKAEYEIGRATYSLPAKLIDLVENYAAQESQSRSDVVSAALIEFFAGRKVKPKKTHINLMEVAKKQGVTLWSSIKDGERKSCALCCVDLTPEDLSMGCPPFPDSV